ncbi:hypothetical protein [Caldalkalibacillus salinus]|uniref:hypothetical protein n=1 Tax=Caldalkalibacillus salinus TaxID=2803787 RepID=UPI001924443B|nr:hypothetical protein [Caldalkalibacillus salinus]
MKTDIRHLLEKAHEKHVPVDIMYMDQRQNITQRTIFVKTVGEEHVEAFCLLRHKHRTFQLDKVLAVQQRREIIENQQAHTWTQFTLGIESYDAART